MTDSLYLTTLAAIRYAGVTEAEFHAAVAAGEIVADRAPLGASLFSKSELNRWIESRETGHTL